MSIHTDSKTDRQAAALRELAQFPLLDALYGRRARRISLGSTIPDGPLAYESPHEPVPLTELERMVVLTSMAGTTGWHYSITRNAHYAGHMANYAAGAAGRTFPSAAGFHTSELFFTDDSGTYFFGTRDAGEREERGESGLDESKPTRREWDHPEDRGADVGEQDERGSRPRAHGGECREQGEVIEEPVPHRGDDGEPPPEPSCSRIAFRSLTKVAGRSFTAGR